MTASTEAFETPPPPPRLLDYTPDLDAKAPRRRRRNIGIGVILFCFFYGLAFAFLAPLLILAFLVPLLVLGLLVVWSLPDTNRPPTKYLSGLLFIFVAGLILWPNYVSISLPGLPWITVVRLTSFPLSMLFLICLSVSKHFRETLTEILKETPYMWRLVLAFAVVQILVIAFSDNKGLSLNTLIIGLTSLTATFFVSTFVFRVPGSVEKMALFIWGLAVIICLMSLLEWRHGRILWAGHLPSILRVEDRAVLRILAGVRRDRFDPNRVQGSFSTPLGLAEFLALASPFILQFALGKYRIAIRIAAACTIPPLIFVVIVSGSRLGLIGCFLTFMVYGLFWGLLKWRRDKAGLIGPALVISYPVLFVAGFASTFFIHRLKAKFWGNGIQAYSDNARKEQWALAIPKILSHPQGHGGGTSGTVLQWRAPGGDLSVDSYFITILLDYGFIGFFIFYGLVALAIYYATKWTLHDRRDSPDFAFFAPIAIFFTNFLVIKSVFSQPENHPLIFMMMGMLAALVYRAKTTSAAPVPAALSTSPHLAGVLAPRAA